MRTGAAALSSDVREDLGAGVRVLSRVVVLQRDAAMMRNVRQTMAAQMRPVRPRRDERAEVVGVGSGGSTHPGSGAER